MTFETLEIWEHMGLVARGVLFTLVVMSLWSAGIVLERFLRFATARRQSESFSVGVQGLLEKRDFQGVLRLRVAYPKSPLCEVVAGAVFEYQQGVDSRAVGYTYDIVEAAERSVDRTIEMELSRMRRGLGGLASISSSAPFVGLFGTTFGIINSFRAIGLSGQGDLATVAPGIAEALITTAFGIFVALPALWFFNNLMARVDTFSVDLRHAASETLDLLIKELGREKAAAPAPRPRVTSEVQPCA